MRRAATSSAGLPACAAVGLQARAMNLFQPKSDIWMGGFELNQQYDEFRLQSGRVPDHDMAKYRKMYWRIDEAARRAERHLQKQGRFFLPTLDYPIYKGVKPLMSAEQLRLHFMRHHRAYVDKLNALIPGTKYAEMNLDDIIRVTAEEPDAAAVFNNAAQHYNHCFFWKCIQPFGSNIPPDLLNALEAQYDSLDEFKAQFQAAAMGHFGSGWVWLVYDGVQERFDIVATKNAETALTRPKATPLLVLDVWEHAWYSDLENEKAKYVAGYFDVVDWHWAERHWKRSTGQEFHEMRYV